MKEKLSPTQIEALESMSRVLEGDRWVLIGATAVSIHAPLPRATYDVDLIVATSSDAVHPKLAAAGWTRNPKKPVQWRRGSCVIDVLAMTDDQTRSGVIQSEGFDLTVVGFDLALIHHQPLRLGDGFEVCVALLEVLVPLKMIAWLDRRHERTKDLRDIAHIFDSAIPDDDESRWSDVVVAAEVPHDVQGAFLLGSTLGAIAKVAHLHLAQRCVDRMRDDDSEDVAMFLRAARRSNEDDPARLLGRLSAFEQGLAVGAASSKNTRERRTTTSERVGANLSRSVAKQLHDALDARRIVELNYDGLPRLVEVHVLGTKDGKLQILVNQIGGESSSPLSAGGPNWRRFELHKLSQLRVTEATFTPTPWNGRRHSEFDSYIAIVRGS